MAIVPGGGGCGYCWKNDRIVFVDVPVDLFSFLFVIVVNGKESTITLVAVVLFSCNKGRKLGLALDWNAMVIGIACEGLM